MMPFKMILIVAWLVPNPAIPDHLQGPTSITEVFPDEQICDIALAEQIEWWTSVHENVQIKYADCVPAGKDERT